MLKEPDRRPRDSTLFQFTTRRVRDSIDPDHLLIQIDKQFDFAKPVVPLEDHYCPDNGRLAIHPEVMVSKLPIRSRYDIHLRHAPFHRREPAFSTSRWIHKHHA